MEELFNEFEQYLDDVDKRISEITDKDFNELLINQAVVSAYQFVMYTLENIEYAVFSYKIVQNLYREMINRRNDLFNNTESRESKQNGLSFDFNILGIETDYPSLCYKHIRDCFQYQMNAFDTINHIISVGLLLEHRAEEKKVNQKYIHSKLNKNKEIFKETYNWYKTLIGHEEFKYINQYNNRTKHTSGIKLNTSIPLIGKDRSSICSFDRGKNGFFKREPLYDKLITSLKFTIESFLDFLNIFKNECVVVNHTIERYHTKKITRIDAYHLNAYIESEKTFDEMPDKIEVLFVKKIKKDNKELLSAKEFPFEHIIVLDKKGNDIGVYESRNGFVDDSIVHYHLYSKTDLNSNQIKGEEYSKEKFDNMTIGEVKEYGLPKKKKKCLTKGFSLCKLLVNVVLKKLKSVYRKLFDCEKKPL